MQRKNCPIQRRELKQQTPTMLFKKSEFGQVELLNASASLLPQFNLFHKRRFDGDSCDSSFKTPPMEKNSVVTPKAPIKSKIVSKRVDLKPKKLQYTEEESDIANVVYKDTDIVFDQSNNNALGKRNTVNNNRPDITQKKTTRSHTKLDKIKIQTIDKENDRSVIENRSKNTTNISNNVTEVSSIVFDSNTEVLSQCDNNLTWEKKLHWLQKRRDTGLWVECCRATCKKWRYVEEYHDPTDVPKIWYCEMNSDKSIASCTIPEIPKTPVIEADLIENEYNAGSIVWVRVSGYPWWPAIVNDSPETCSYYILQNSQKPTKFRGIDYRSSLNKAYELASRALQLSISERLQKFSFLALYEKMFDINNNALEPVNMPEVEMDTNSDEEVPPSNPSDSISLKDYYLTVLCKIPHTRSSHITRSLN
ncbi:uncharacterized protein LOC116434941 isoform X2 [Nomia melanderi]|uniref:uncharacterized protein LOC116434941 isoform X2 n=1 Tax=Nomia melanderi TaxID=2448451 RepID=UPI003FCD032A